MLDHSTLVWLLIEDMVDWFYGISTLLGLFYAEVNLISFRNYMKKQKCIFTITLTCKHLKQIYLTHRWDQNRLYHSRSELTWKEWQ